MIKKIGVYTLAICLLFSIGLTVGCTSKADVAATLNGEKISTKTLDAEVAKLKLQSPELFDTKTSSSTLAEIRTTLLEEIITQNLLLDEAKKQGIEIKDKDIDNSYEMLKAGYGDESRFESALKNAGLTKGSIREQIKWQLISSALLVKAVPPSAVSDEEVATYFAANKDKFKLEAAKRASHILLPAKDKAKAEQLLQELKNGADFAKLAKENSTDTMCAQNGGDLGWPTAAYVPEFEAAIDSLKPGDSPKLIQSAYGWHIVIVTDQREAGQGKLEDVKDEIRNTLLSTKRSDAYQTLTADLRKNCKVEILDEVILKEAKNNTTANGK